MRQDRPIPRYLFWALPMGWLLAMFSWGQGSHVWGFYCTMLAWLGTAQGFAGSHGFADHVLGRPGSTSAAAFSPGQWKLISLFTFWLPNIAMVAFSFLLTKSLQPELQPTGSLARPHSLWFFQCMIMYFCGTGAAWSGIWSATRKKS
ncbi:MAG: hypothetical protein R3C20_04205 [Planctomycetaceae bacterium]